MDKGIRMLVVEDEPLIAMMLEDFLDVMGAGVSGVAETVAEALELIEAGGTDAAIVDVNLKGGETSAPVMDALSARGIPFIVSSGAPGEAPDGAPRLAKPFSLDALERAVRALPGVGAA